MSELVEYPLDFSKALAYFEDNLNETNRMSSALCKHVQFEKGTFYTILRHGITDDQLYGFKWGGVDGGSKDQIIDIMFNKAQSDIRIHYIFDDVNSTYTPSYDWSLFSQVGVHYNDEVYYIVSGKTASKALLKEGLNASDAIWHSLCVLSDGEYSKRQDRSITEFDITNFAKEAQMIVVGAYDGEGYICWEKRGKTK